MSLNAPRVGWILGSVLLVLLVGYAILRSSSTGPVIESPGVDEQTTSASSITLSSPNGSSDATSNGDPSKEEMPVVARNLYDPVARLVPAPETSIIGDRNFHIDSELKKLLREFGGWEGLYRVATDQERAELIVAMGFEEELRNQIPNILPIEPDTEMRAMMIHRVDPEGYYDDVDPDVDMIDHELIELLELEMGTPSGTDEWLARLDLAAVLQGEYGVVWTRRAMESGDRDVEYLAAILQVNLNKLTDSVTQREAHNAEDYLFDALGSDDGGTLNREQRIRGYTALLFASDRNRTLEFYQERVAEEEDPGVVERLDRLIKDLESILGS